MSIGLIREKGLFAEGGQGRNRVVLQVFNTLSVGMCIFVAGVTLHIFLTS